MRSPSCCQTLLRTTSSVFVNLVERRAGLTVGRLLVLVVFPTLFGVMENTGSQFWRLLEELVPRGGHRPSRSTDEICVVNRRMKTQGKRKATAREGQFKTSRTKAISKIKDNLGLEPPQGLK